MNGSDVLKQIKENPATKDIPVIIVTALVQEIDQLKKMMNPADVYLVKSEVLPADIITEVKKRLGMTPETSQEEGAAPVVAPKPVTTPKPAKPTLPPPPAPPKPKAPAKK